MSIRTEAPWRFFNPSKLDERAGLLKWHFSGESPRFVPTFFALYAGPGTWDLVEVPRAREIHQPLLTSPLSCLQCARACWDLLLRYTTETREGHAGLAKQKDFPDLILCNGPATATVLEAQATPKNGNEAVPKR